VALRRGDHRDKKQKKETNAQLWGSTHAGWGGWQEIEVGGPAGENKNTKTPPKKKKGKGIGPVPVLPHGMSRTSQESSLPENRGPDGRGLWKAVPY